MSRSRLYPQPSGKTTAKIRSTNDFAGWVVGAGSGVVATVAGVLVSDGTTLAPGMVGVDC